jgi:hypothetical protein
MTMATQCKFFGHIIKIEKALAIRNATPKANRGALAFACIKCGKLVRPHVAGDRCGAHFVHVTRNPQCQFTDPPRDF